MTGLGILLAVAATAVDYGWQPNQDGKLEYIIQIEPELLQSLKEGQEIASVIDPDLRGVTCFRIRVGNDPPPRDSRGIGDPKQDARTLGSAGSGDPRTTAAGSGDPRTTAAGSGDPQTAAGATRASYESQSPTTVVTRREPLPGDPNYAWGLSNSSGYNSQSTVPPHQGQASGGGQPNNAAGSPPTLNPATSQPPRGASGSGTSPQWSDGSWSHASSSPAPAPTPARQPANTGTQYSSPSGHSGAGYDGRAYSAGTVSDQAPPPSYAPAANDRRPTSPPPRNVYGESTAGPRSNTTAGDFDRNYHGGESGGYRPYADDRDPRMAAVNRESSPVALSPPGNASGANPPNATGSRPAPANGAGPSDAFPTDSRLERRGPSPLDSAPDSSSRERTFGAGSGDPRTTGFGAGSGDPRTTTSAKKEEDTSSSMMLACFALFVSLSGNAYLTWICWGIHERYRKLANQVSRQSLRTPDLG